MNTRLVSFLVATAMFFAALPGQSQSVVEGLLGSLDQEQQNQEQPQENEEETPEQTPPATPEDLARAELETAMENQEDRTVIYLSDVSGEEAEMAAKNLYYDILSTRPDLKAVYDMTVEAGEQGSVTCQFSYMPYWTGQFSDDFTGIEVQNLQELITVARENLDQEEIPIRIVNSELQVDDMNNALQQVGGGYLYCSLNRDGTAITVQAQHGLSHDACIAALEEIDELAQEIVSEYASAGSERERAQALYNYMTANVTYDQRYYDAHDEMPFTSTTATGALRDNLAICGGYAQALQALFEHAGIMCYTVSGTHSGESHMWDIACIDGEWLYFDATIDAGRDQSRQIFFAVEGEALGTYVWDEAFVAKLIAEDD